MKRIPQLRRCLPLLTLAASLQITLGYYDPAAQRWITRDPIGEGGGINLSGIAGNNLLQKRDPWGHAADESNPILLPYLLGCGINNWLCRRHRDTVLAISEAEANANAPDGSTHRGQGAVPGNDADLLTHCIASCELARHPGACDGPDRALGFLQQRETGNDPATQIDRLNNEVGAGIGVSAQFAGQSCAAACLQALEAGLLHTLINGAPFPPAPRDR
jgi:uncharacterized protein RhaS with RHS repeats